MKHQTTQPEGVDIVERSFDQGARPYWTADDVAFLLEWPILRFASLALPERRWPDIAMGIVRLKARLGRSSPTLVSQAVGTALKLQNAKDAAEAIAWAAAAGRIESHIQVLKSTSAGGWKPEICIKGNSNLGAAMDRGRGAIVWVAHFCFSTLVTKMALHEAGYRVSHFSRPEHGFSTSTFGIKYLNPIRSRSELKYLAERIVINRSAPTASVRAATKVLAANRVLSITAGAWEGRRLAIGPFFGGRLALATGAPGLAHRTGAHLLPVFTTKTSAPNRFVVRIGEPILCANGPDRTTAIREAVLAYLRQLETAVSEAPEQWRGWKYIKFLKSDQHG